MIKRNIKSYMDSSHVQMIDCVVKFALDPDNISVTSSLPPLLGYIQSLQANMNMVSQLRASIANPIVGIAAANKARKDLLSAMSANIMSAAYSYAVDTDNLVLAAQMRIATSELKQMRNIKFISVVRGAINLVTPLLSALSVYGVTAAGVAAWQSLIEDLKSKVSEPRVAITFRKTVNQQIQLLLRGSMETLYNKCDRVMMVFRETNLDYYNNYKNCRKLVPQHLSTQVRIHVKDQDGKPVTEGEVFVLGTDRNSGFDQDGYALVNNIPFGRHKISVTTPFGSYMEIKQSKSCLKGIKRYLNETLRVMEKLFMVMKQPLWQTEK